MTLAVDSEMASNVGFGAGGSPASPQTFSFTNTAGTLLVLVVGIGAGGASTVTLGAVSYNDVPMTQLLEKSTAAGGVDGGKIALYYLLSPATGSNTVSFAYSVVGTAPDVWAGAISFTGNDGSTPMVQSSSSASAGTPGTTATATLNSVASGNITVCGAGAGSSMSAQTKTLSWAKNQSDADALGNGRCSRSTSTGTVTHDFTISGSDSWATVIAEIAAAAGGPAPITKAGRGVIGRSKVM